MCSKADYICSDELDMSTELEQLRREIESVDYYWPLIREKLAYFERPVREDEQATRVGQTTQRVREELKSRQR